MFSATEQETKLSFLEFVGRTPVEQSQNQVDDKMGNTHKSFHQATEKAQNSI